MKAVGILIQLKSWDKEYVSVALKGLDILWAAQTGSGKTLAFLIPVSKQTYWYKRSVEIHEV